MVRHQAALASGTLTRVTSGVNLPPSEVIMSRLTSMSTDSSSSAFVVSIKDQQRAHRVSEMRHQEPILKLRAVLTVSAIYQAIVGVGMILAPRQFSIDAVPADAPPR
jgi:hypothetical protein